MARTPTQGLPQGPGNAAEGLCLEACRYKALQFRSEPGGPMEKCDLCLERWEEGKKHVCVESCPARALDADPVKDLQKRYGATSEAEGFIYSSKVKPSIMFKPK